MGKEFELKFAATEAQQAAVAEVFGIFTPISMETTYYDTPRGELSARYITLRRRFENGISVCTVKTPGDGFTKGEWEVEWDDINTAIPMLCKLGCPEEVAALTQSGITPICGARFTRQAKTIDAPGCTVELALDKGILLGGGKETPLCEIEVELKSGEPEAAVAFAEKLAARFDLTPLKTSKFRRALALAKGE